MNCNICPGMGLVCVNCPHWVGHKRAREREMEAILNRYSNAIGEAFKKGIEDAHKKNDTVEIKE